MKTKKTMKIDGMMCEHCAARVKTALEALDGVKAKISVADKAAYLTMSTDVADDTLTKAVTDAGYQVVSVE